MFRFYGLLFLFFISISAQAQPDSKWQPFLQQAKADSTKASWIKAIENYKKALALLNPENFNFLASTQLSLANVFSLQLNEPDSAAKYYYASLAFYDSAQNKREFVKVLNSLKNNLYDNEKYKSHLFKYNWLEKEEQNIFVPLQNVSKISDSLAEYFIYLGKAAGLVPKTQGSVRLAAKVDSFYLNDLDVAYYIFDDVLTNETNGRIMAVAGENLDSLIKQPLYLIANAEVPQHNYESIFYKNFLNGSYFKNNYTEQLIPYQIAVNYSSPFLENVLADSLVKECLVIAEVFETMPDSIYKIKITEGKFNGHTLVSAFKNIKPSNIESFFDYVKGNPQHYSGYDGYMAEVLALWMFQTPKGPMAFLDSMLLLSNNKVALNSFQKRNQHLFNTDYYNVINKQAKKEIQQNNLPKALRISDVLIALSEAGTDTFKIALSYFNRAYFLMNPNTESLSNEWYQKSKKIFVQLNDEDNILIVNKNMQVNYNALKDYEAAGKLLDENIAISEKLYKQDKNENTAKGLAAAYSAKAKNWAFRNNKNEEISAYQMALKFSVTEKDNLVYMDALVKSYYNHNMYAKVIGEAKILIDKYLKIGEEIKAAAVMDILGFAYSSENKPDEAIAVYSKAYSIYYNNENFYNAAFVQSSKAQIFWQKFEKDSAIFYHNKSIDLKRTINDSAGIAYSYTQLAKLYKENGLLEKSNEAFLTAEQIFAELPVIKDYANLLRDRAENYASVQQYDQAIVYYEQAKKVYEQLSLFTDAVTAQIDIAFLKSQTGNLNEAERILKSIEKANESKPNFENYFYFYYTNSRIEQEFKNNTDAALACLRKSLHVAQSNRDSSNYGNIFNLLGKLFTDLDEVDSAEFYLRLAEKEFAKTQSPQRLYSLYTNFAYLNTNLSKIDSATFYYKRALSLAHKMNNLNAIASSQMNLSNIDIFFGDYGPALKTQQEILEVFLKNNESFGIGNAYLNLGNIYNRQTQFDEAIKYYNKADSVYAKVNFLRARLTPLNNAGTVYYAQGNIEKAQEQFESALKLLERFQEPSLLRTLLINMGEIYIDKKDYAAAKIILDSTLKLSVKAKDKRGIFITEWMLGRMELRLNNFTKALPHFEIAMALSLANNENFYNSAIQNDWAEALYALGNYDSAAHHWNSGIKYSKLNKSETYIWKHYSGLAKVALQKNDNETARLYLDSAITVVEGIKLRISGGEEARKIFSSGESVLELYQKMATVLKNLGRNEEALLYIEKANVENINSRLGAENKTSKEDEVALAKKQKLLSIEKETALELAKPTVRQNTEAIARLAEMQTIAEKDYLNFITDLAKKYPNRTDLQQINAREFKKERSFIPEDVALLSYLITPNELSIFVVTKDSLLIKDIPVNKLLLENKIKEYYAALSKNSATAMRGNVKIGKKESTTVAVDTLAAELYNILLEPALSSLKSQNKIAIIPSGFLSFVPFQALGKPVNNTMQYFGNEKEVFYVNRITNVTNNRAEALNGLRIIAVGNTDNSLPFAEAEVKGLIEQYPASVSFIKSAATKKNVLGQTGDYNILHLATHGILDYNHADSSYLLLAKDPLHKDDGKLHINDIYSIDNLNRFKLVTLSACETAVVKDLVDGWPISTAAAFLEAGVSTVVASLWQVDDRATGLLMQEFYKNMKTMSKVEALQKAQLYIQKMPNYSHPYYWAAFQVVGLWK